MIDWNQIKTVFLDMDGTLLDLHYDNYFWLTHLPKRYAELKSLSLSDSEQHLRTIYETHADTLKWYCLDFWEDSLEIDLMALKYEVTERIAFRPNVQNFLHVIHEHEHDFDIAIITNAHRKSVDIKLAHTNLGSLVSKIISSHDFQIPKEQPEFWQKLQQAHPFDPGSTAFFDDNEKVLASAKAFGIQHLYSIAQPDSAQAIRESSDFPLVYDFKDITP